jgi:hypothetical protein
MNYGCLNFLPGQGDQSATVGTDPHDKFILSIVAVR